MNNPDERLYELEIVACDDGDYLLTQGFDGGGDEIMVRLHRTQLDLLAGMAGFVSENEVARVCERLKDRLNILAALIHSQTDEGDPLRAAVAAIVPDAPRRITATAEPRQAPESAPATELADASTPAPVSGDLFSEYADEVQT